MMYLSSTNGTLSAGHIDSFVYMGRDCLFVIRSGQSLSSTSLALLFAVCHPTVPSLAFFRGLHNEVLTMIEFSDHGIAITSPPLPGKSIPDSRSFLGVFPSGESISIILCTGLVLELRPGAPGKQPPLLIVDYEPPDDGSGEEFIEPPTFWQGAESVHSDILITDDSGNDLSVLLVTRLSAPRLSPKQLSLTVKSTHPKRALVGVILTFSAQSSVSLPKAVMINGRVRELNGAQGIVALALTQAEAARRVPAVINIVPSGLKMLLSHVEAFALAESAIPRPLTGPDWRSYATGLTDFADAPEGVCTTDAEYFAALVSAAEFAPARDADRPAILALLTQMYERPRIALACRRILMKAAANLPALPAIWGDAISAVCQAGNVAEDAKRLIARDFSLLPPDVRHEIEATVWAVVGVMGGFWGLFAGLTA
jgi:hypothetical protein